MPDRPLRICVDLDGVICRLRREGEDYEDLLPVEGAVSALRELRQAGHTIIIYTARHMKTCEGNVGRALARIGGKTLRWLERHEIEYDEIYFGKPQADVYIDDNAFRFDGWDGIGRAGAALPRSTESVLKERS